MKIYIDKLSFTAEPLENDRFLVKNPYENFDVFNYIKSWISEVINHEPNTHTYKRECKFIGDWANGKMYGCFPIRVSPDTVIIVFDRIEYD